MTVLVTGATGLVGSLVVEGLVAAGVPVREVEPEHRDAAVCESACGALHERMRHAGSGAMRQGRDGDGGGGRRPQDRAGPSGFVNLQRRRGGVDRDLRPRVEGRS